MTTKIERYYVVINDLSKLDREVNKLIEMDWEPLGGISYNPIECQYVQAMVKKKEITL
jgi:hypothetical protein